MLRRVSSAHSGSRRDTAAAPRLPGVLYTPEPGAFDEAIEPDGTPRPHYAGLLEALAETDLSALAEDVHADVCRHGIEFGGKGGPEPFRLDLVPRLITAEEWDVLERGLAQRVVRSTPSSPTCTASRNRRGGSAAGPGAREL